MKRELVLCGAILSIFVTSSSAISLRDSVEKALNNNPNIQAERKNQEAYRKYIDESEGKYLPSIDLEGYIEKSKTENDPDSGSKTTIDTDGYNAAIVLNQLIYDGGLTPAEIAESKYQNLANKYRSNYAIENTVLETIKSYNNVVQYNERLALSSNMIKTHEENLITAKEKEEISGEVLETYQVASKLHFVTDSYIEEEDLKDTSVSTLKRYIGVDIESDVCRPNIDESKVPGTLKEAIEIALLKNYRILEQIERIKLQREKIAQADASFLPNLSLELKASFDKDLEITAGGRSDEKYARLNFSWNLFNGTRDSAKTQRESIFLQEQKKTLDDITNEVVTEVKSLYGKFYKNKKRIEALKKYVDANMNIVEVYRNEFEAGTRTFVDILDAEGELYSSSKGLINMEYTALNNYYDLMFNLSSLSDVVLTTSNQNCADVKPRVISYLPKKQDKDTESELNGLISTSDSDMISKELGKSLDEEVVNKASTDAMKMSTSGYKSFLEAPKDYYTINIATKNGMGEASKFIKENNLKDDAYAFEFGPKMKSAKVLYGVYSSVKEAKKAMQTLSPNVLAGKPYVDNISKHQALYAKYN